MGSTPHPGFWRKSAGKIEFHDIEEGETVRLESEGKDSKKKRYVVVEHKGERHPQIKIKRRCGRRARILDFHFLPAKARIDVEAGQIVEPGHLLARQPKESKGTSDITSGLPRVTEIFEARKPRDPSIMAEISGSIEIQADKKPLR